MKQIRPTLKNIMLLSILYQAYPVFLCVVSPEGNKWGIFAIAEAILIFLVLSWKARSKAEVIDEREKLIRLQVHHVMHLVLESTLFTTIIFYLILRIGFGYELPTLYALLMVSLPAIFAEVITGYYFRSDPKGTS